MKKIFILFILSLTLFSFSFVSAKKEVTNTYTDSYHNTSGAKLYCGGEDKASALVTGIPSGVVRVVHIFYLGLQIVVPVLLIIFGMIDLIKAIVAGKEDEIKKHQMTFIRRLITAVLVFFVFAVVKLVVNLAADDNKESILNCVDCFLNNRIADNSSKCGK